MGTTKVTTVSNAEPGPVTPGGFPRPMIVAAECSSPARRPTVLVVEDDTAVREIMSEILRQNDYNVLNASGGIEALQISRRHAGSLEIVLTDLVMPEMNGLELANELRSVDPDIKVIYMSGYGTCRDADYGYRDPAIPLLQKPIRAAELLRLVREVINQL